MRYLGIDFGLKRVGLATSEGFLASSLKTLEVKNFKDSVLKVGELIKKGGFDKIVVGLPEGRMGQTVLGFINALKKMGFEVESADETLSSKLALEQMIEVNSSKKDRRSNDSQAACIILQNWLDNRNQE